MAEGRPPTSNPDGSDHDRRNPDALGQPGGGRDAWAVDGFAPLPSDTVSMPKCDSGTVETVYLCAEPSGTDTTRWSWIVLTDGRLLEVAPRGCALYEAPDLLARGTGPFLELAAQDGALVRFEERVRAGTWAARPVRLMLDGHHWRLTSTGTVTAQRLGPAPASAWGQLHTTKSSIPATLSVSAGLPVTSPPLPRTGEGVGGRGTLSEPDVYFTLVGLSDPAALGLGLWMTDVCLAFGRRLGTSPQAAGLRVC